MSLIYESEETTRDKLEEIRKRNVCAVCGGWLNMFLDAESGKAFVACFEWPRSHHDGIEREASRYEKEGLSSLNINTRREILEEEYGKEMTTQLEKYQGGGALTKASAMEILKLVYPNVPEPEIIRTALLCRDFGLHPLMKEVYIIGYKNTKTGKTDYSTVLGINANRKLAADKKGAYSFLDDTPRAASHEEVIKQYGLNSEEERDNLVSICRLRGETGNEVVGFGLWLKNEEPKAKKGNTKRNMANIRSERQAMDRLPGAAIPLRHLDVIDESVGEALKAENVIEVSGQLVDKTTGEIQGSEVKQHWCEEHNCPYEKKTRGTSTWYAHKLPDGDWCNEGKQKEAAPKAEELTEEEKLEQAPFLQQAEEDIGAVEPEGQPELDFDKDWLLGSLRQVHWQDATVKSYLKNVYGVDTEGTVVEVVARLTREAREKFFKEIQDRLDML